MRKRGEVAGKPIGNPELPLSFRPPDLPTAPTSSPPGVTQHSTAQHSTAQHSTAQHSTAQRSRRSAVALRAVHTSLETCLKWQTVCVCVCVCLCACTHTHTHTLTL